MEDSYRELRYTYITNSPDDTVTAGEIMRVIMKLSSREISRCKKFEDGVMCRRPDEINRIVPVRLIDSLFPGDELIVRVYEDNDNAGDIVPADGPLDIAYEDEDLIIVNKPGEMVVHPSYAHYRDSLSNYLLGYFIRSGQRHVIRTVGRLDRETSGLVIFAKNRHAAALMAQQIKTNDDKENASDSLGNELDNMSRRKEYLALCSGVFDKTHDTIDAPIRRRPDERMIREVHPEGKRAVTHYEVVQQYNDYALVRLRLDTGRTHQIRVHMAYIGHPLLGDNFYGKEIPDDHGMTRAALHAGYIEFVQPITGEKIVINARMPEDMGRLTT